MDFKTLLSEFLKWRVKHISDKRFLIILSILIGALMGLVGSLLKFLITVIEEEVRDGILKDLELVYFFFPLLGIAIAVLYIRNFVAQKRLSQSVPFVLYSIGKRKGFIRSVHMYGHLIASALTVGLGGSVGLEGPSVVTGSAIGSNISQLFHLNHKRKVLLLGCGAAAAISALFNSPIAGVIFVLEIILVDLKITFLIPLMFSSASAFIVAWTISDQKKLFGDVIIDKFTVADVPFYIVLGLLTGLVSWYYITTINKLEDRFIKLREKPWKKFIYAGLLLATVMFLFPTLYGEGYYTLRKLLAGKEVELFNSTFYASIPSIGDISKESWVLIIFLICSVLVKVYAYSFTKIAGGNGGVFAPSLFTGGTIGFILARTLNNIGFVVPEKNFTLVGMAGMAAGMMHAPLTAIFLIAEITGGYALYIPLMIVVGISYGTSHRYNKYSYFTTRLARNGDLVAHDKDHSILRNISVKRVIEKDFVCVNYEGTIADLVKAISKSHRNIFPILNNEGELKGIILLDDVRHLIFNKEKYEIPLSAIMHPPPAVVGYDDSLDKVMEHFDKTQAWNLPVLKNDKYYGFLSKSKIFNAYRKYLAKNDEDVF
jgi:CIC family chloride channel protein